MLSASKLLLAALTFDPRTLSPRAWLDGADTSTMYNATSGGSLVVNNGTIARWEDKSANLFHFTQADVNYRPTLRTAFLNGRSVVWFDGANDQLRNTSISIPCGTIGNHSIFAVCYNLAQGDSATPYRDMIRSGAGELASFVFGSRGGLFATFYGNNVAPGTWNDITSNSPASTTQQPVLLSVVTNGATATPYYNGVAMTTKSSNNNVTYSNIAIGSVNSTPKNLCLGPIAEILIFNRGVTTAERNQIHAYLSAKWGFNFAQFTGFDPDAARYISRVFAAGSSMTVSNMNAVNTFVLGCKSDGIWSAFQGCSLLAGPDTLAGALMPLVGPVLTNVGHVDADYNRLTGLKGDGTSKYLNSNLDSYWTGDAPGTANSASRHLAVWMTERMASPPAVESFIGAWNSGGWQSSYLSTVTNNTNLEFRLSNGSSTVAGVLSLSHTGIIAMSRTTVATSVKTKIGSNAVVSHGSLALSAMQTSVSLPFAVGARRQSTGAISYSGSRYSFYSIGTNLDLDLLSARIATYMSSLT